MPKEYNKTNMLVKARATTMVYEYVMMYVLHHGAFPTYDEIASEFGYSRERARQHCERLVKLGYLRKFGTALHRAYAFKIIDLPNVSNTTLKKIKVANEKIKKHYAGKTK